MLIGPKAAWSRAFLLLLTTHTLQVMEMTRILLFIISVCHLGTKYRCATWLCFTAVRRAVAQMMDATDLQRRHQDAKHCHKGTQIRSEVSAEQTNPSAQRCLKSLKSFNARHCATSTTTGVRSGAFLSWSASCRSCWHTVCGRTGEALSGRTADSSEEWRTDCWGSIITVKPCTATTEAKNTKMCFYFTWNVIFFLKSRFISLIWIKSII